jgi:hypothetical protein
VKRPRGYNVGKATECVLKDGSTQVMEHVVKERAALTSLKGKKRMYEAFRLRAGMIGILQSCLCDYPLGKYETPSGHDEVCPSTGLFASLQRAT